jgi:xanthine dehydrogenase molybdopterin-binding subunit B
MMSKPTPEEITVRLHQAMDAAVGLPSEDIDNVQSMIEVGEWLLAFETLCTQIYEWQISLSPAVIRDLQELGSVLGDRRELARHLWEDAADVQ